MNVGHYRGEVPLSDMLFKTLTSVAREGDALKFFGDGFRYDLEHEQCCCESVWIEDIAGDLSDLVGAPVVMSEVSSGESDVGFWHFYKFATRKGYVDVRFCAEDNYYSTAVEFVKYSKEAT